MSGLTGNNILSGSSGQATGYNIDQSLRFEDGDSAYLNRTPASASNRKTWTFSAWVKRGNLGISSKIFQQRADSNVSQQFQIAFQTDDTIRLIDQNGGTTQGLYNTTAVYRDSSAWYHIVVACDTTNATASDRVKLYVNGVRVTNFSTTDNWPLNYNTSVNNTVRALIGAQRPNSSATIESYFDGYLAEVNLIDGQALDVTAFGETNEDTNQWQAIEYTGSYGTNGFYLKFQDSSALGDDSSGNTNDFTVNNLVATDQVLDSPTNNFSTLNPLDRGSTLVGTFSEGNTRVVVNSDLSVRGTIMYPKTGKWYAECLYKDDDKTTEWGFRDLNDFNKGFQVYTSGTVSQLRIRKDNVTVASPSYPGVNTIYSIAYDADTGDVEAFVNGSSVYSGTLGTVGLDYIPHFLHGSSDPAFYSDIVVNYGQDSSFAGNKTAQNNTDANGIGDFYYTPPSGYLALCEDNLPDPSIALPNEHFNTVLWTGDNSGSQVITGVGFQPDFVWMKGRSLVSNHAVFDVVRGAAQNLRPDLTNAEITAAGVASFDTDGFTLGNAYDTSPQTYVAWNWKADNTSGSSNTDGTITSTVSANTTAGFSIVSYTSPGTSADETVGHGLSQTPELVIIKNRDNTYNWDVWNTELSSGHDLILNQSVAQASGRWSTTIPTASLVTLKDNYEVNGTDKYIAYCFHSVEGYSKVGSYTGNGSADGTFIYTGFRPAFLLLKRYDSAGNWILYDNKRDEYNPEDEALFPNLTNVETTQGNGMIDFNSNGFKLRNTGSAINPSSGTCIYLAIAESPFKYSNAR